jgi:hypothetical protein
MATSKDKHANTKEFIRRWCRQLTVDEVDWINASDPKRYNCFGFAVGILKWWQPPLRDRSGRVLNPYDYWPSDTPNNTSVDAYVRAAEALGFQLCEAGWETGFERIVLFFDAADKERPFTHAALQIAADRWKSKIGKESDIEHPESIGCAWHGTGRIYMKRPRQT